MRQLTLLVLLPIALWTTTASAVAVTSTGEEPTEPFTSSEVKSAATWPADSPVSGWVRDVLNGEGGETAPFGYLTAPRLDGPYSTSGETTGSAGQLFAWTSIEEFRKLEMPSFASPPPVWTPLPSTIALLAAILGGWCIHVMRLATPSGRGGAAGWSGAASSPIGFTSDGVVYEPPAPSPKVAPVQREHSPEPAPAPVTRGRRQEPALERPADKSKPKRKGGWVRCPFCMEYGRPSETSADGPRHSTFALTAAPCGYHRERRGVPAA